MSDIIELTLPSPPFYIGKGLRFGDDTQIMIFGYPIPNDLSGMVSGREIPWSIINPTTRFDCSGRLIRMEVGDELFHVE